MIDKRPRIIDVERKPQKCPVCGERVVDIIYGTGSIFVNRDFISAKKSSRKDEKMSYTAEQFSLSFNYV